MTQNEMRYLAGSKNSPLADLVGRALAESGGWSIDAMRAPGYRALEAIMEAEGFRAAAPLPDRAQVVLDKAVIEVGLDRLTVAADIMAAGLTYNLNDPLSVPFLEWNSTNKVGAAKRTMTPSARGENKLPIITPNRLPIYLTTDNFELDIRTLKSSQRNGMPLDTSLIKQTTRAVNEAVEDATINGATTLDGQDLSVAGYEAPGLLNAPNAEAVAATLADWTTTPNGANAFADVMEGITDLQGNKKYGPYHLYIPTAVGNGVEFDYNATNNAQGLTIRQRLLQISTLRKITTADLLPSNKAILVQMTSDVVDMVVGQTPTVIPWTSLDGFTIFNLVMAILIPRVRSDYNGDSGVCVITFS